jgi:hypothetical protein
MAEQQTIDVTGVPEVFLEGLDYLVYMIRMNVPKDGREPPAMVNGIPFKEWREGFLKWVREYKGGPLIDDSRYTIYGLDPQ